MRIKRIYLLIIFISSLLLTNFYYANTKPPLVEHKPNENLILITNNDFHKYEIITTNVTLHDNFIIHHDVSLNNFILSSPLIILAIYLYRMRSKFQCFKDIFEYWGILFRYRKRVLTI